MRQEVEENSLKALSLAIGTGVLAGLAGTAAITISQLIEMKLTNRKPSTAPVQAVSKVLDVKPISRDSREKVSQEIHWAYGTIWGIPRGVMAMVGLTGWPATALHFAAIAGTAMTMLPNMELAPPVTEQQPKDLAIDALHHAVYAIAAGAGLRYHRQRRLTDVRPETTVDYRSNLLESGIQAASFAI